MKRKGNLRAGDSFRNASYLPNAEEKLGPITVRNSLNTMQNADSACKTELDESKPILIYRRWSPEPEAGRSNRPRRAIYFRIVPI